jgi:hypothetical protein
LSAIAECFYQGLPACLSILQEGITNAWQAGDGVKPTGLYWLDIPNHGNHPNAEPRAYLRM